MISEQQQLSSISSSSDIEALKNIILQNQASVSVGVLKELFESINNLERKVNTTKNLLDKSFVAIHQLEEDKTKMKDKIQEIR